MLKIAVCDDNNDILEFVAEIIKNKFKLEHSITVYNNIYSLFTYLEDVVKGNLDIIFMDIDLGDENNNGIDYAIKIKENFPHIKIIFITGFLDYAPDVFDADPVSFILKPLSDDRVLLALEKADKAIRNENSQMISLTNRNGICNIKVNSIKYIESNKRTIYVYDNTMKRDAQMKLDDIETKLPSHFLRCHQSFIVNMDRIKSISINGIELHTGEIVPVSRPKYNESKKKFLDYLGGRL